MAIVVGWSVSGGFAASFGANVAIRGLSRGSKRKERQGKKGMGEGTIWCVYMRVSCVKATSTGSQSLTYFSASYFNFLLNVTAT